MKNVQIERNRAFQKDVRSVRISEGTYRIQATNYSLSAVSTAFMVSSFNTLSFHLYFKNQFSASRFILNICSMTETIRTLRSQESLLKDDLCKA